jgi:hypothetical protein
MILFLRAKLESKSPKRVERSLMQLEVSFCLIDILKVSYLVLIKNLMENFNNNQPESKYRFQFFYAINFQSVWKLKV